MFTQTIQALHRTLERIAQWSGQSRFQPRSKKSVKALAFLSDLYHSSDDTDKFREFSDLISSQLESLNLHINVRLLDFSIAAAKDTAAARISSIGSSTGTTKSDSIQLTLIDKKYLTWEPLKASNKLGQGGFSTVTIGMYKNEYVAIKHVQHLEQMSEKDIKMVTKEAMIMQFADHPNILGLKGVHLTQGLLVMELALCSLADYLHQTTPLAQERAKPLRTAITTSTSSSTSNLTWKLGIICDVANALQYLHSYHILHRDIKSPNILLFLDFSTGRTIAKVADFGVALAVELVSHTAGTMGSSSSNTAQRAVGTNNYMAPELFDRHPGESIAYSEASDVYSLGILVNEIMTERIPWATGREYDIKDWVLREQLRPAKWVLPLTTATVTATTGSTEEGISIALHGLVGDSDTLHCCWSQSPMQRCSAMEVYRATASSDTSIITTDSTSPSPIKPATGSAYPVLSVPPASTTSSSISTTPNSSSSCTKPVPPPRTRLSGSGSDKAPAKPPKPHSIPTTGTTTPPVPPIRPPRNSTKITDSSSTTETPLTTTGTTDKTTIDALSRLAVNDSTLTTTHTTTTEPPTPQSLSVTDISKEHHEADSKQTRIARQLTAKQPRYEYHRYSQLRTVDDYTQGLLIFNKSKAKESFLSFQTAVIPKSLTVLNKEENRLAVQVHRCLLIYMGDKANTNPVEQVHELLQFGFTHNELRDEIYLQIIKQVTNNPLSESVGKGWQVLCMSVNTFPPSVHFENFLLHFLIEKTECGGGAVVDYAKYCLRTLEAMLHRNTPTGFMPSIADLHAYQERPPILATIYLVDGTIITEDLPLTPDMNVAKVLEMCIDWLDLKDPRINTLGMFVYDLGLIPRETDPTATAAYTDLKRTPRLLRSTDYMGDVVVQKSRQRRLFKFVLKRKLFAPKDDYRGEDLFFERLTYLQAEDEAINIGSLHPSTIDEAQLMAALALELSTGGMPDSIGRMLDVGVANYIPPHYRTLKTPREWAEALLQLRDSLSEVDPSDLQQNFLQIVQESPMYGAHWFYVHLGSVEGAPGCITQLPSDLLLAFNMDGMHIHTAVSRQHLYSIPYSNIYKWDGAADQITLKMDWEGTGSSRVGNYVLQEYDVVMITAQAQDIADVIIEHIECIMGNK